VGIITWQAVARALVTDDGVKRKLLQEVMPDTDVQVGYYGRHDAGTNQFQDRDALLLLFDPTPNLGAAELDAFALGVGRDDLILRRLGIILAQAEGRLRAAMGGRKLVAYVGTHLPPDWASGSADVCVAKVGRSAATDSDLVRLLVDWFLEWVGVVSLGIIRQVASQGAQNCNGGGSFPLSSIAVSSALAPSHVKEAARALLGGKKSTSRRTLVAAASAAGARLVTKIRVKGHSSAWASSRLTDEDAQKRVQWLFAKDPAEELREAAMAPHRNPPPWTPEGEQEMVEEHYFLLEAAGDDYLFGDEEDEWAFVDIEEEAA
jgi:hypothetical protein